MKALLALIIISIIPIYHSWSSKKINEEHKLALKKIEQINKSPQTLAPIKHKIEAGQIVYERCSNQGFCYQSAHLVDLN